MQNEVRSAVVVWIRKRSGQLQKFEERKIQKAMAGAFCETKNKDIKPDLMFLTSKVVDSLEPDESGAVDIEVVQDSVENVLMDYQYNETARLYIRYRQMRALARTERLVPDNLAIADYIHSAKYARFDPNIGRRETFSETVKRVRDMYIERFPELKDEIKVAFTFVENRQILPSMRSMQFGGEPSLKHNARIYNCTFTLIDRARAFQEILYLLLCGCGVGFSVQWRHVNKLPEIAAIDTSEVKHYRIQDSIEGWGDALGELVQSHIQGYWVEFDYSGIRPEGSPISSGGKAPGHIPLRKCLEQVRSVLTRASGRKLRPIECHDIICFTAEAVIAGGIRRSSLISLFSADDGEMMRAKAPENFRPSTGPHDPGLNNQRQMANNSCAFLRRKITKRPFMRLMKLSQQSLGDPGFYLTHHPDYGCNPCVTGNTRVMTNKGFFQIKDLVGKKIEVLVDPRFGKGKSIKSTDLGAFSKGLRPVFTLHTKEGYSLDLTKDHKVMTNRGWVEAQNLCEGDRIHVASRGGVSGSLPGYSLIREIALGHVLGWLDGDGTITKEGYPKLYFYGEKQRFLAGLKADAEYLAGENISLQEGTDGLTSFESADLMRALPEMVDRCLVPEEVWCGSSTLQQAYLAALFSAEGSVQGSVENGVSVRLSSSKYHHLQSVQQLLLNFGVFSRIYKDRRPAGWRKLPDGKGGEKAYYCKAGHELVISKGSLLAYNENVGFLLQDPKGRSLKEKLEQYTKGPDRESFTAVFEKLEPNGEAIVYDIQVPEVNAFNGGGLVVHNCGEIGLNPTIVRRDFTAISGEDTGGLDQDEVLTGFSFCNLCEINMAKIPAEEVYIEAAKQAAFIGTLQATFNHFPYLGTVSEAIQKREALLGVSMTGMADNPKIAFDPGLQRKAVAAVIEENKRVASLVGIRPAARVTTIKPSGTASLALGVVGSGIHPHHARRYFRRITAKTGEAPAAYFRNINPHMIETKPNGDWSIVFPIQAPEGAVTVKEEPALDFLERVFSTYENWVKPGTADPKASPGLTHNVSCTVTVRDDEMDQVIEEVWNNRHRVAAMTFVPLTLDKKFPFAPREEVLSEEDELKWNRLIGGYCKVDWRSMREEGDTTNLQGEIACGGGQCEI